ncbi:MAG: hypothetical protein U5K31_13550 [Balneolaceae bacterium]|nr:hypothetical protein [Balneolaceae bacterium]
MTAIRKGSSHAICLPDYGVTLDRSGGDEGHTFISHAHADHLPRRGGGGPDAAIVATPPTARLMRLRGYRGEVRELPFGEPLELERCRVTFLPAGHILGSALTWVEGKEGSVLYTGDCRTPPSPASEGFKLPEGEVDHFITEATFSLPIYRWPSGEELAAQVRGFALKSLEEGATPVFLAYSLGKAQEIMHLVAPLGETVQIHNAGHKLCGIYEEEGIDLGRYEAYDRDSCEGKILVCPSSAWNNGFASHLRNTRLAYCSGWATRDGARTQLTADELIPLSDHLDFFELIRLCRELRPGKVWITHTPNPAVVQHYLKEEGIASDVLRKNGKDTQAGEEDPS